MTFDEIGKKLGVTKQRAEQLYNQSFEAFRYEWQKLTGRPISERDARYALAARACEPMPAELAAYVEAFMVEWQAEYKMALPFDDAVKMLCSLAD